MTRKSQLATVGRLVPLALILISLGLATTKVSANVTALALGRRNCESVTAWAYYDSYSVGVQPYLAAFAADLNGNGIYGEAGEPSRFVKLGPSGVAGYVKALLRFSALPEGSEIAVTAYELDSAGTIISPQLEAVRFACTNKPRTDLYPPNTGMVIPGLAITARITASQVQLYSAPSATEGTLIGGLAQGTTVHVLARNQRGDWFQIRYGDGTAWYMWKTTSLVFGPYTYLPVLP